MASSRQDLVARERVRQEYRLDVGGVPVSRVAGNR